jgi:hypothetical protein
MLQFFFKTVVPQAICGIRMVTNGLALLLMAAVIAKFSWFVIMVMSLQPLYDMLFLWKFC